MSVEDGADGRGASFWRARLGTRTLCAEARAADWTAYDTWQTAGRHFVHLTH
ncbi:MULTISPECIES: hypothetical protein [unclassified Streptomyces]|uniref:hypothetical protein n=1 Tax=unclassified Streptomyces TaxID=2593676 RepID=UPI000AF1EEBE|nr:hypothetical protein [Streptomyces sp. NRRL F-2747]